MQRVMNVDDLPGRRIDAPPEAQGLVCREDRAGRIAGENELCLPDVLLHRTRIPSQGGHSACRDQPLATAVRLT
jgi:hypothetical protein